MKSEIEKAIETAIHDIITGFNTAFTKEMSVKALQAQSERDKMRCENCTWFDKKRFFPNDEVKMNEDIYYTCIFYGDDVPDGIPAEETDFCIHFVPKENKNG